MPKQVDEREREGWVLGLLYLVEPLSHERRLTARQEAKQRAVSRYASEDDLVPFETGFMQAFREGSPDDVALAFEWSALTGALGKQGAHIDGTILDALFARLDALRAQIEERQP